MTLAKAVLISDAEVDAFLEQYKRGQGYNPNVVTLGSKTYIALDPDDFDWQLFKDEVKAIVRRQTNPQIADAVARRAPYLWDAVRLTNANTKNGFKGSLSRGDQLMLNALQDRDLGRAGGMPGTSPPTGFYVAATVAGTRIWPPSSGSIVLTVSSLPVLAHVYIGFTDPVAVPKVSTVQLVLDSDPWAEEVVDFEWQNGQGDNRPNFYELRAPWVIRPGASYRVSARYYIAGDDKLTPVGFSVMRAVESIASIAS